MGSSQSDPSIRGKCPPIGRGRNLSCQFSDVLLTQGLLMNLLGDAKIRLVEYFVGLLSLVDITTLYNFNI